MLNSLLALKNLMSPDPPQPPHEELEHSHWDREARIWRSHDSLEHNEAA